MRIIPNHFKHKTTYLLGLYVLNGCMCFHIDDLDKVCEEHWVPDNFKEHVLRMCEENKTCKDHERLDEFIKVDDHNVRRLVAAHGRDQDLDVLVHDKDVDVLVEVAKHGKERHLDILVFSKHCLVKQEIVMQAKLKYLDILVRDTCDEVRLDVIRYGEGKHLIILSADRVTKIRRLARQLLILFHPNLCIKLNNERPRYLKP